MFATDLPYNFFRCGAVVEQLECCTVIWKNQDSNPWTGRVVVWLPYHI